MNAQLENTLDAAGLKDLAAREGPCLTILIPEHRPGAGGPRQGVVDALLRDAAGQAASSADPRAAELVNAARAAVQSSEFHKGGGGIAVFTAPGWNAHYPARISTERAVLGSHSLLTPLLPDALASQDLLVLALSRKRLRLFDYRLGTCTPVIFPAHIPESLEAAGSFRHSEPHLSHQHAAGASGQGNATHFGSTNEQDRCLGNLETFFEGLHRELRPVLAGRPLFLLGVQEEIAAYRRAAGKDAPILAGQPGNADYLSAAQIATMASHAAVDAYSGRGEAVLTAYDNKTDRGRTASEVFEVLHAAAEGRVHQLCVRESTPILGKLPNEIDRAFLPAEDLVNAAVVETLRAGGEVFVLPQSKMHEAQPLAAILRY